MRKTHSWLTVTNPKRKAVNSHESEKEEIGVKEYPEVCDCKKSCLCPSDKQGKHSSVSKRANKKKGEQVLPTASFTVLVE